MLYKKQFKCVAFQNSHYLLKHILPNVPSSYQSPSLSSIPFLRVVGVDFLGHIIVTYLPLKTAKMFSKVAAPFHILASNIQSFQILHVFNNICEFQFL